MRRMWHQMLRRSKIRHSQHQTLPQSCSLPIRLQPAVDSVQNDFSAAFGFVQQGIEHLGTVARNELFALARKYL